MSEAKHVLVVEDDVDLCNSIMISVNRAGYKVVGATHLQEACFRMKNQKYDCLLFDMRLSNQESGEDLIKFARERKDSLNTSTPIVVISGHLDEPLVRKIARSIQGALVKPFEMSALLSVIQKLTS